MKHIGFTGTRHGMTREQQRGVDMTIATIIGGDTQLRVVAHHGDCIGSDEAFQTLARMYGCAVCVHPPTDTSKALKTEPRENFDGTKTVVRPAKPYLDRNADIVAEADVMIATPAESTEQQRGGTWSTIRYARKAGKPLAIVWPNGCVTRERWPTEQVTGVPSVFESKEGS